MATDMQIPSLSSQVHTNGSVDTEHEINEYRKIIKLRDEIYAGKNPHFKLVSQPGSVSRSTPQAANQPTGLSTDKNRPPLHLPHPGVPRGQHNRPVPSPDSTVQMSETEINDILLAKSDVLVNAEIKLKRQRIEKELRRQVEEKRQVVRGGEEDLNLKEVMEKVGLSAKITCPEEPTPEDVYMQTGVPASRRQGVQEDERTLDTHLVEASRGKPPPTGPAAMSASRDQEIPLRDTDLEMRSYSNVRDTMAERVYSPPARPRYSATSQLRSPAAPQPVRPANMARVESQDPRIVDVEEVSYGRYPESIAGRAPYRSRASPVPYVKPEPASPGYREPAPRIHTPERGGGGRPSSRISQYDSGSRARYDYPHPHVPPTGYYPPPALPLPVPTHRPYDPYAQREADPYAYSHFPHPPHPPPSHPPPPPPLDYTHRSYTPAYVPPVSAYPPRPVYDDYDRRYPPPPVRQPSRIGRRSASPPGPYRHARHSSRSMSPIERGRRMSPRQPHVEYRPMQSRIHSPPHFDHFGRSMLPPQPPLPPPPPPPLAVAPRGNEVYAGDYGHPGHSFAPLPLPPPPPPPPPPQRERSAYGDERAVYYPSQPLPRYDEPPPRPESSITAREADIRSYRDREYSYSAARASLPPPPLLPGSAYPPSFNDYSRVPSRAASRALMGPPSGELIDYSRMGGDRDYHDRPPPVRPDERDRERDYAGRASVRPEERGYLPARHASVRPDVARGYGDREYQRRDESRERYNMEPPPPLPLMGVFGSRDERSMQPPRPPTSYAGSEYGERYSGKY